MCVVCACTCSIDGDEVVNDDGIGRMKQRMQSLRNVGEFHFQAVEDLHQIPIAVDQLTLMRVLQQGKGNDGEKLEKYSQTPL